MAWAHDIVCGEVMLHSAAPMAAVVPERDHLSFRGPHKEEIEPVMPRAPYASDFAQGRHIRQRRRESGLATAAGVA